MTPNHISVIVRKEDFETTEHTDPRGCALATTLKREGFSLGSKYYKGVGMQEAYIEGEEYTILEWTEIIDYYDNPQDLQVNLLKI